MTTNFLYPQIGIILLTYKRTKYAVETVASVCHNLRYDGMAYWYIADDGSDGQHMSDVKQAVIESGGVIINGHSERWGYGRNANTAWTKLSQEDGIDITLWIEDDWRLERPFDISPYVRLLCERHDKIGMVRLGHMPVDLYCESFGYRGNMYMTIKKNRHYTYSGNPHLKHIAFADSYGYLPQGKNPGETEIAYDATVRLNGGVDIVWPLLIGDRPFFAHIGEEKSYV